MKKDKTKNAYENRFLSNVFEAFIAGLLVEIVNSIIPVITQLFNK